MDEVGAADRSTRSDRIAVGVVLVDRLSLEDRVGVASKDKAVLAALQQRLAEFCQPNLLSNTLQ